MDLWISIISIMSALLLGAMSPGPSFVIVARNSVLLSRSDGAATALGMGVGGIVFCSMALAGLYSLLASVEWLYIAAKFVGALYLFHIAWQIWRGSLKPLELVTELADRERNFLKSFWMGLSTQLSNPKTAIVYGSIFVALLPKNFPFWCYPLLSVMTFLVEAGWYTVVALVFSSSRPKEIYLKAKSIVDRTAALTIGALGVKLILTTSEPGS